MNKLCLICIFLLELFSIETKGQTFAEGDSLFANQHYDLAQLAYEKTYFEIIEFSKDSLAIPKLKNEALLKKVFSQKALGNFHDAINTTKRFDFENINDSLNFKLRYERVVCHYLVSDFEGAYTSILQLRHFVKDSSLVNQIDFWEILTLNELNRYEEAKKIVRNYVSRENLSINTDKLYTKINLFKPKKAQTLATFIPGAGLFYAGKKKEGAFSLALQLASLGYGTISFINGYYFSGFFLGLGLFQAFYFGGIHRTELVVETKNKALINAYNTTIKNTLLKAITK